MRALRYQGPGQACVAQVAEPEPGPNDVVVTVSLAGVCGTDLMVYEGRYDVAAPLTMGHEYVGVVAACGANVHALVAGDRVVSAGGWSCGACTDCVQGHAASCRYRASAGRTVNGCFAEYVRVPAGACYRVPQGVADVDAQAFVTVATTLRALQIAEPQRGCSAAVIGSGHSGLLLTQLLAAEEAAPLLVGTRDERLVLGQRLGAGATLNVRRDECRREIEKTAEAGGAYGLVFEASGTGDGLATALALSASAATVVVYSIYPGAMTVNYMDAIYAKVLTIRGSRGGDDRYPRAMELLNETAVTPGVLAGVPVDLDEGPRVLDAAVNKRIPDVRPLFAP